MGILDLLSLQQDRDKEGGRMLVYIAAPYTKGDIGINLHRVFDVADQIIDMGHTPIIPHLTHLWHIVSPKPWEFWLKYDEAFLDISDAVLRLNGDSIGADMEVKRARELCIPVYYSVEELEYGR